MDLMLLSARDLSNKCLETFQQCLTFHSTNPGLLNQVVAHDEQFEYRLADFNLWIDGIGALAPSKASLDSRLSQRQIDLSLVKGNLIMLLQSLEDCLKLLKTNQSLQDTLLDIDSALESLVSISLAVRRTGRKSRLYKADRLFNEEEHKELRKHLEAIILLRPREGPCDGDNEFKQKMNSLTAVQNHLVMANLKRRNRYIQAHLHSLGLKKRSAGIEQRPINETAEKVTTPIASSKGKLEAVAVPVVALFPPEPSQPLEAPMSVTSASIPESKLEYNETVAKKSDLTPMTIITQITASARYPRPRLSGSEQVVQCPCCCQMLPVSEAKSNNQWRKHLAEDIRPYTCIFDRCPTPDVYYSNRSMLEQHFRQDHPPVWECPLCQVGAVFLTMTEFMDHLHNSHPQVTGENIPGIISSSAQAKMGIENCPLCEVKGDVDSSHLIDHVLEHIHDFSLRSLPWPTSSEVDMGGEVGSFNPDCEASFLITRWLEGYKHVTEDIDPDLKLSNCDYGRLAVISEQIQSRGPDKLGLHILFADEHGDESAKAETDVSQFTQDTLDSLEGSSQASESDDGYNEEIGNEAETNKPVERQSGIGLRKLTDRIFSRNKGKDLELDPEVVESLNQFPTLNPQAYDVLTKVYQRRVDPIINRNSRFSDFIRSVQGQEISSTNHTVSDLHGFLQVMVDYYLCALKPLPPKDLTKTISNYFINTSYRTFTSSRSDQAPLYSIREALCAGYRSIDIDVWDLDDTMYFRNQPKSGVLYQPPSSSIRDAVKKLALSFAKAEDPPAFEVPKITLSIPEEPISRKMPVVTADLGFSESLSFLDFCVLLRDTAFLNSNMPIIVNFKVYSSANQQKTMVDIMTEEWRGLLLDEPIDDCDPKFKLPQLGDLQNRILVKASRPVPVHEGLPTLPSVLWPPTGPFIEPLESLNVYLKSEPFEGFESRQSKTPTHVFSWQKKELQKLISSSPGDLLKHNKRYVCRVTPKLKGYMSSNLDPSDFWKYGVHMVAINHCIVDEGFMVNSGIFNDEEGWISKPLNYQNTTDCISNHLGTTPIRITSFSILVFENQRFQLMTRDDTRKHTKDLSPLVKGAIHSTNGRYEFLRLNAAVQDDDSEAFGYRMAIIEANDIIPELTVITMRFADFSGLIAWTSLRLDRLNQGYRLISLYDKSGGLLSKQQLLVKIRFDLME